MNDCHERRTCAVLPVLLILVALILIASSCARSPSNPSLTPPPITTSLEALASETPTQTVTSTPEKDLVVLLSPDGTDTQIGKAIQSTLEDLTREQGLRFETRPEVAQLDLEPSTRMVVVLPPDPGIANLVEANPSVQFLAVGIPGLQVGSNLSLVGAASERPDQQGFLAGYLAAVITPDWRVGVIAPAGTVEGKAARQGFVNGVIFYCGLCRPSVPPFVQYPIYVELPPGAGPAEQQAAADQMVANAVKTVYLAPGVEDPNLVDILAQAGFDLIGSTAPPDALRSRWVASIQPDQIDAIRQLFPMLAQGEGGRQLSATLAMGNLNPEILSVGRQRLVEKMLSDLLAGFIDTGVNPETGDPTG